MTNIFRYMPCRILIERIMSKDSKIKIESPVLRTADNNYTLFLREILDGKSRFMYCKMPESDYNKIKGYFPNIKVRREEA